jgi:PhnB protein
MNHMSDKIPAGYHSLTPSLAVRGAADAIGYYERAFGAQLVRLMRGPDGSVMHAELRIGDSMVVVYDEIPAMGLPAPAGDRHASSLLFYTPDADAVFARAVAEGGKELSPMADIFSGDRMGVLVCPYGHRWAIAARVREVPDEEVERAARAWLASSDGDG